MYVRRTGVYIDIHTGVVNMALHTIPEQYEYEADLNVSGVFFPRENYERVKTFKMAESDVVVASYPKSGTTWMQEILYQVHTGAAVDSEESKTNISFRVPMIEISLRHVPGYPSGLEYLENTAHSSRHRPRLMKTHCPSRFFENHLQAGRGKFVVIMRNIKDTLVSYYHFYTAANVMYNFGNGTWEQFFDLFKAKKLSHGDWLDINLSWWKHRGNTKQVHILKYEDMKKDLKGELIKLIDFLGVKLSESQVDAIVQFTSYDSMKDNPAVNYSQRKEFYDVDKSPFMRKGIVGSWHELFTPEQSDYVQKYYIDEASKHGLIFEYD